MAKFKVGDVAWSAKHGFATIEDNEGAETFVLWHGQTSYTADGKPQVTHPYPTLLTLEEAAKLGYYPKKIKGEQMNLAHKTALKHTFYCLLIILSVVAYISITTHLSVYVSPWWNLLYIPLGFLAIAPLYFKILEEAKAEIKSKLTEESKCVSSK